jgi:hypothetical protein
VDGSRCGVALLGLLVVPALGQQGGDTCQTATNISGPLPVTVSGTTSGYADDYDEACPYAGSTSPDVVYKYTPPMNMLVDLLLCLGPTDFDSKLYIYTSCPPCEALACNDDACTSILGQGYVSALWSVSLFGGQTYYFVVDGYNGAAGNYTLDIRPSVFSPTCPDGGNTVFGQAPDPATWTIVFSDLVAVWGEQPPVAYEDFYDARHRITGIRFWGLNFEYDFGTQVWAPCVPDAPSFVVGFYEDAGGQPGPQVYSYTVATPAVAQAGWVGYSLHPFYEFNAPLDFPCVLQNGWVSIVGAGPEPCWFVWLTSAEGDSWSWVQDFGPGSVSGPRLFDLALCLTSDADPVFGACCDDAAAQCQDGVEFAACAARFEPDSTCDQLAPACGAATGACCDGQGGCTTATYAVCLGSAPCSGDLNCDGLVDFDDINPFILALSDPQGYAQQYPNCRRENADCNGDGAVNFDDINAFVARMGARCGVTWLGAGSVCDNCAPPQIRCPDDLPFAVAGSTCSRMNRYSQTCLGAYDEGPEAVYELLVTTGVGLDITLNPGTTPNSGLLLDDEFPPVGDCLAFSISSTSESHGLGCQWLNPGTYYVLVDGWPSPASACIPQFQLTITQCVPAPGRCCYGDPVHCATLAQHDCVNLGGRWDAALDCNTPCPPLDWDDCAHAYVLPSQPSMNLAFSKTWNAVDGPAASCDKYRPAGQMQQDLWLVWTAPADGLANATASTPTNSDIVLVARSNCVDLAELACADDLGDGAAPEHVQFVALAGRNYYFQIGYAGSHAPRDDLSIVFTLQLATVSGACCFPNGGCQVLSGAACFTQGGAYQGDGTTCAAADCPQPTPGSDCSNPVEVTLSAANLPFVDHNTTSGRGNDYVHTCLGSFDGDADLIYRLNVTEPLVLRFSFDPHGTPYTALALSRSCPPDDCLFTRRDTFGDAYAIDYVVLVPGVYYLMVDSWLSPQGIVACDLTIDVGDTDAGACCVAGQCYAGKTLAECLGLGGGWWRNTACGSSTCQPQTGDNCLYPTVVNIPWELPYQGFGIGSPGNDYSGTTCLGLYDGGRDVVYQLVVHATLQLDIDVQVNVGGSIRAALSTTCPPIEDCEIIDGYVHGVEVQPGVYYLLIDRWPYRAYPGSGWQDDCYGSIRIDEAFSPTPRSAPGP